MPMKRLAWDEMQKRRSQGLCFNCDDKFTPCHKCRKPQLLLLEGDYDLSMEDDEERVVDEPQISLHALTRWSTTRTMRIMARIENQDLNVLIDSGSTHNFISERIAIWLQLLVIPTKPFNVKVVNGNPLKCLGRFENIQVLL